MLKLKLILSFFLVVLLLGACEKEYSVEGSGVALFTFNGTLGECTGAITAGTFKTGIELRDTNKVTLTVNVTAAGYYEIATNTADGISFSGSGTFTTTGIQSLTLVGSGTPEAGGSFSFNAGSGTCSFIIEVSGDSNTGGTAVFTSNGAPGACTEIVVGGNYYAGTPLGATNAILIGVNVTTPGNYTISTNTVNGFSFSASGAFTVTGNQSVQLKGTGTPAAAGKFTFIPGTNGCSFDITVTGTTPPVTCKDCTYFPLCEGTKYTFEDNSLIGGTATVNADFTEVKDTTIDGQAYRKVTASGNSAYYNCTGGVLTAIAYNLVSVGGSQTVKDIKLVMLKANEAVGATWKDDIVNNAVTPAQNVEYFYSIVDKGITWNVLGVDYTDVIHVHVVTSVITPGFSTITNQSDYYYAKGIGMIESEIKDEASGLTIVSRKLKSYLIP